MDLQRVSGQIREVQNRNALVSRALDVGYIAFLPVCDLGVDLILHREADGDTRLVQLKSRWSIARKYLGRNIWIAFPIEDAWFLAPHDDMVEVAKARGYTDTKSWTEAGIYYVPGAPKWVREWAEAYRL